MNGTVIDGNACMAITEFGLSSKFYRTDIHEAEETWNMLNNELCAGRICAETRGCSQWSWLISRIAENRSAHVHSTPTP